MKPLVAVSSKSKNHSRGVRPKDRREDLAGDQTQELEGRPDPKDRRYAASAMAELVAAARRARWLPRRGHSSWLQRARKEAVSAKAELAAAARRARITFIFLVSRAVM